MMAWIVGKGPSLRYLRAEHFGPGPVITLNQAIQHVEELGLQNKIYSLQKDGVCHIPKQATMVLHDKESGKTTPDYDDVIIYSLADLGFDRNVFSLAFALNMAKLMGCSDVTLVSCDLQTHGIRTSYIPGVGEGPAQTYLNQKDTLYQYTDGLNINFLTPENGRRPDVK